MIALGSDCLLFRLASGEYVPFSSEMVSVELVGDTARWFDEDFVKHAAKAVFHYFKHDLGRETVTVGEFACALEKVLRGFKAEESAGEETPSRQGVVETDLCELARESAAGCELLFFPRLRAELRYQLQREPRVLRFRGLRGCVKCLTGAQRWGGRCQTLEEQIVTYLRQCLDSESKPSDFALVIH